MVAMHAKLCMDPKVNTQLLWVQSACYCGCIVHVVSMGVGHMYACILVIGD